MDVSEYLSHGCRLCPRKCGADRYSTVSFCKATGDITAARASLHMWEEPCISGERGSGTIFFSGCPLKCVFCQNKDISRDLKGKRISPERLCEIFFELEEKGAHNINLVSPTPYIPHIINAIELAKKNGFTLEFVFNSSGYENTESLALLDGLIDIYLPDFKYFSKVLAKKYSAAPDYPETVIAAIDEMVRQQPKAVFDKDGLMKKGVIVRHLVLPGSTEDSKKIIKHLHDTYKDSIYVSIMSQYTPVGDIGSYTELSRKITQTEYDEVVDYAIECGITNGFIQDGESAAESFIPDFDSQGI